MGLIVTIMVAVLAILAAAASRMIADEFKAWTPWVIRYLIKRAVQHLRKINANDLRRSGPAT